MTAGAGDNTIVAVQTGTAATETFSATDTIDGGAGTDTIVIIVKLDIKCSSSAQCRGSRISIARGWWRHRHGKFRGCNVSYASEVRVLAMLLTWRFRYSDVKDASATMDTTVNYTAAGVTGTAINAVSIGFNCGADLEFAGAVETMNLSIASDAAFADLVFDAGTTDKH